MNQTKLKLLERLLESFESCVIAYSGGVDSVFLAHVAHRVLGDKSLAVIADSPSLPRSEFTEAVALAEQFRFPFRVVKTTEFDNPEYVANPLNRCYFCKHELFTELEPIARDEGFRVICYGENASDVGDFRPGSVAAKEFQVRAPLKEAGLTKAEIRELSAGLGLPTADKPQMACLSSRIPHGEQVTEGKLRMIEDSEAVLKGLGFYDVRVRHHESVGNVIGKQYSIISGPRDGTAIDGTSGSMARIEVGVNELPRLLSADTAQSVAIALRSIGYQHVAVDLQGYRRGSLNERSGPQVRGLAADRW